MCFEIRLLAMEWFKESYGRRKDRRGGATTSHKAKYARYGQAGKDRGRKQAKNAQAEENLDHAVFGAARSGISVNDPIYLD